MEDKVFRDTTATRRVFKLTKRIRAVSGGTAASKTVSILVWIIDFAQSTRGKVITVVGESLPHMKIGAIRDFKAILINNGYWQENSWNESNHTYTFPQNSIVEFISFDKFGKAHGPRRDVLFLNEANNIPYQIADQLMTRTREIVWLDWNPSEEFWFYTEVLPHRQDVDFITLTFLDNEALDEISKQEILSHQHNKEWWTVYGLGQLGVITSRIYKDWQIIDEVPFEARLERYAIDFGYSNDPTALGAIYYYNGGYIVDELLFVKLLSNKVIADTIKEQPKTALTVADSAEPKSIDEIRSYGVNIIGSEKGKDSVVHGIQTVQNQRISITRRSANILREYRNYLWMTDRDGRIINEPEHEYSHSMDMIRYGIVSILKQPDTKARQFIPHGMSANRGFKLPR